MATIHTLSYQATSNASTVKYDIDIDGKQQRLRAVLAYDGISESQMHIALARIMNISRPVAKRMLFGNHRTILKRGIKACIALNICVEWLFFGQLRPHFDRNIQLRTQRVHMQGYKGHSKEQTDKAMRFNMAYIGGLNMARNLMHLVQTKQMNYLDAVAAF